MFRNLAAQIIFISGVIAALAYLVRMVNRIVRKVYQINDMLEEWLAIHEEEEREERERERKKRHGTESS